MAPIKTILVVDDDALLRAGLQTMLQAHGYRTLEAEDGRDARVLIDEQRPDLVILDMMMPRWGGFAVLEHFQHQADSPPFIMITAHEGEKHKAYAKQIGAIDYLHKPFAFASLIKRIDHFLQPAESEETAAAEESLAATIRITCPVCDARIKTPVQLLGQTRPCPRCKHTLTIERDPPSDEGPQVLLEF